MAVPMASSPSSPAWSMSGMSSPPSPADAYHYQTSISHPLPTGTKVHCKPTHDANTQSFRPAEILKYRVSDGEHLYYVHYTELDKRMDEWITIDRLDVTKLRPAKIKKAHAGDDGTKGKCLKGKKRKAEGEDGKGKGKCGPKDDHPYPHDDHHKPKNISKLYMGKHAVIPWYFSPYHYSIERFPDAVEADVDTSGEPPENSVPDKTSIAYGYDEEPVQIDIYLCEFCLKPLESKEQLWERHMLKCKERHPPGDEIYRDADKHLSVFEVDGRKHRAFCQNVCLLSKLFLEHKFLKYDVEPFMFYVMTEWDSFGHHFLGYFSKEKESPDQYNVACILTLPPYQKRGIGRLLIEFSYELSKKEDKVGSPEKPLSDLGARSYHSYWTDTLLELLIEGEKKGEQLNVNDLSKKTCMKVDDIQATLQKASVIGSTKRNPQSIVIPDNLKKEHNQRMQRITTHIDPLKLHWTPAKYR